MNAHSSRPVFARLGLLLCFAPIVSIGCRQDSPVEAGRVAKDTTATTSVESRPRFRTIDDEYAELVDQIPGFGGLFYDSAGTLSVYLKDPASHAQARPKLSTFLGRELRSSPARRDRIANDVASMRVLLAKYDFQQLLSWSRAQVFPSVANGAGVTSMDIDERQDRIVIGVRGASRIPRVRQILAGLAIPGDVVVLVEREPVTLHADSLTGRKRPVPAGMQLLWVDVTDTARTCSSGFNLASVDTQNRPLMDS